MCFFDKKLLFTDVIFLKKGDERSKRKVFLLKIGYESNKYRLNMWLIKTLGRVFLGVYLYINGNRPL